MAVVRCGLDQVIIWKFSLETHLIPTCLSKIKTEVTIFTVFGLVSIKLLMMNKTHILRSVKTFSRYLDIMVKFKKLIFL